MFFAGDDGVHGVELWKSDGSEAGTVMVEDLNSNGQPEPAGSSFPSELTPAGNTLYFFDLIPGAGPAGLWKTDGTEQGTVFIRAGFIDDPTALGNSLFFGADDDAHGAELWKTDGTPDGTVMITDINPAGNSGPYALTAVADDIVFGATGTIGGRELWVSDGTAQGTSFKDINPVGDSNPDYERAVIGHTLFFVADDGTHGRELWSDEISTDQATTCVVTGLRAGPPNQQDVTVSDADGIDHIDDLFITNGTVSVPDFASGATGPLVLTATKTDQTQNTGWYFSVTDSLGYFHFCR